MNLICPSCQSRFAVKPEMFASGPRKVRCVRCGHVWRGAPETDLPPETESDVEEQLSAPDTGPIERMFPDQPQAEIVEEEATPEDTDFPDMMEALSEPHRDSDMFELHDQQDTRRRTPLWVWSCWLVLVLIVAATAFALVFMREPLVKAWPPLQRLYDVSERILTAKDEPLVQISVATSDLQSTDGKQRMSLMLKVVSGAERHLSIPPAEVTLLDGDGLVIKAVEIQLPGKPLAPREERMIPLILDDVPPNLSLVRARTLQRE